VVAPARIRLLPPQLADQIAAGEVVERPASIVKELVENAIDAGATRVEVELEEGGRAGIRVVDDGRGIVADDLDLAVARHATSKIHAADDLVEIGTLGFRGEALASIAAVARLVIRSRVSEAEHGAELEVGPGRDVQHRRSGMPRGTQVEVHGLFASVPARRKFLRSEAAETSQCVETVLRLALVEPGVHFVLRSGSRELLGLPATSRDARVRQVLSRRSPGEVAFVEGSAEGVGVCAWIVQPEASTRARLGPWILVRRRVVRERSLAQIFAEVLGPRLLPGTFPVGVLGVEPPRGDVDVNVHPQKAEVRFAAPQVIYAAVREVLGAGVARTFWSTGPEASGAVTGSSASGGLGVARTYSLATRAADGDYERRREELREQTRRIAQLAGPRAHGPDADVAASTGSPREASPAPEAGIPDGPRVLAVLPGPTGVVLDGQVLWAVDLRRLRNFLVVERMRREFAAGGAAAQVLLLPVVANLPATDVRLVVEHGALLQRLGFDAEPFAEDAVVVRAIPAALKGVVEEPDVSELLQRLLPWLRVHRAPDQAPLGAAESLADAPVPAGVDRWARRWIKDLLARGLGLADVPGSRRWTGATLLGER
jgi:DNA mismatch repair protein MutL